MLPRCAGFGFFFYSEHRNHSMLMSSTHSVLLFSFLFFLCYDSKEWVNTASDSGL